MKKCIINSYVYVEQIKDKVVVFNKCDWSVVGHIEIMQSPVGHIATCVEEKCDGEVKTWIKRLFSFVFACCLVT